MAAGDELRTLVPAVVDDGFVNAAKTRSRIRANVFKPQRLDHIHHEVRPGAIRGQNFRDGWNLRLRSGRHGRRNRALQLGRLRRNTCRHGRQRRGPCRCTLQKIPAIDNGLGSLSHESAPRFRGYFYFISHGLSRMPSHKAAGCLDFCSAHLQVGNLESSRSPPEGGRYMTQAYAPAIAIPEHCTSAALTLLCREAMFEWKACAVCWRFPRGVTALAPALPEHCKDLRQFRVCTVY